MLSFQCEGKYAPMEISLSIVGSAGRKDDAARLSKNHFQAMCLIAEGLIKQLGENNYPVTHLVSGGAAWADHVAVRLFLDKKIKNLRLFLPAQWTGVNFKDNGIDDFTKNPGKVANYYHRKFQLITNINSLVEIQSALVEGAELIPVEKGFYARNTLVAKSDCILAMTFGNKEYIKSGGGSEDTVRKYLDRVRKESFFDKSFHYNLNDGKIYIGCKIGSRSNI